MRFAGARVFVTGATGYIGRHVVRKLVDDGALVTALVRPSSDASYLKGLGVALAEGNVTDRASLDFAGHDLVVHSAAWVGFGIPAKRRQLFWDTNVTGTENVLDAARRADVPKIVHVSSVAALGRHPDRVATEDDWNRRPATFLSYYEESKTAAHRAALESGLNVALPMPGLVVGKGSDFDPIFRRFAEGKLRLTLRGDAVKGWVHVDDTAEGILLAALKGRGSYLLVDDCVTASEMLARLAHVIDVRQPSVRVPLAAAKAAAAVVDGSYHAIGKTPPISRELVRGLEVPMRYDSARARRDFAWKPDLWGKLTADLRAMKPQPKKVAKGAKAAPAR